LAAIATTAQRTNALPKASVVEDNISCPLSDNNTIAPAIATTAPKLFIHDIG